MSKRGLPVLFSVGLLGIGGVFVCTERERQREDAALGALSSRLDANDTILNRLSDAHAETLDELRHRSTRGSATAVRLARLEDVARRASKSPATVAELEDVIVAVNEIVDEVDGIAEVVEKASEPENDIDRFVLARLNRYGQFLPVASNGTIADRIESYELSYRMQGHALQQLKDVQLVNAARSFSEVLVDFDNQAALTTKSPPPGVAELDVE